MENLMTVFNKMFPGEDLEDVFGPGGDYDDRRQVFKTLSVRNIKPWHFFCRVSKNFNIIRSDAILYHAEHKWLSTTKVCLSE